MAIDTENPKLPTYSGLMKGCLITTAVVLLLFMVAVYYFSRLPSVQSIQRCEANMQQIAGAISRYEDVTGRRPADLAALKKEYLPKGTTLRCPLDRSPGDTPSYAYHPDAGDGDVMLECDRHKLRGDMPGSRLVVYGDGTLKIINPGIREAMDKARKQDRR
jgi:hypothetical protein